MSRRMSAYNRRQEAHTGKLTLHSEGDTVTIKAHKEKLDIQGVTVAKVNDKLQVTSLETWLDPVALFNQMRPDEKTMEVVKVVPKKDIKIGDSGESELSFFRLHAWREALTLMNNNAAENIVLGDDNVVAQIQDPNEPAVAGNTGSGACPFGFTASG